MHLLLTRLGPQTMGVPANEVEQIVRMAAVTPLPMDASDAIGLLNMHGDLLLVVDPRPRMGLPTPMPHPDQRLILVGDEPRYLLWVDAVDAIESAAALPLDHSSGDEHAWISSVATIDGQPLPVLNLAALRPTVALHAVSQS
jgi:purine-binding chemotaxis protein CheW